MSVNRFGRVEPYSKPFKYTYDFQFDVINKRLANVADPINDQDVVTLNYLRDCLKDIRSHVENELKKLKEKIQKNSEQ